MKQAFGADFAHLTPFLVGQADLTGDHRPDLIIMSQNPYNCGSAGCGIEALLATAHGYAAKPIDLGMMSFDGKLLVLDAVHQGMHDLSLGGSTTIQVERKLLQLCHLREVSSNSAISTSIA